MATAEAPGVVTAPEGWRFHEVAAIFPLMAPREFAALKADIAAQGQREPIWMHEGYVIDGRNRLLACLELGIAPRTRKWDGKGSLVGFVVSLNFQRRHLSASQRAACGAEIEERLAVEAKRRGREAGARGGRRSGEVRKAEAEAETETETETDRGAGGGPEGGNGTAKGVANLPHPSPAPRGPTARDEAAQLVGASPRAVQDALMIREKAPELHEQVKQGEITVHQAKRQVARAEKLAKLKEQAEAAQESPTAGSVPHWEVITGDAVPVLGTIDAGSARLVFADPPYNIGVDYGKHMDDSLAPEAYLAWSRAWIEAAARVLAPDGSLWLLINHEWAAPLELAIRAAGLSMRAWITWYETFGVNRAQNFNRTSRRLLYAVRDPKRFVFDGDAVNRPSDRQAKHGDRRADPAGKIWDDVWGVNPPIARLVENAAERIPDFPTQLPLALLLPIVGCASEPGDLIVDPFSGSGTSGEAALRLGRRYTGIELWGPFAELARLRLSIVGAGP